MEALKSDWDDDRGMGLKRSDLGEWEGQSWPQQRTPVWRDLWRGGPLKRRFHCSGLAGTGDRTSARQCLIT